MTEEKMLQKGKIMDWKLNSAHFELIKFEICLLEAEKINYSIINKIFLRINYFLLRRPIP